MFEVSYFYCLRSRTVLLWKKLKHRFIFLFHIYFFITFPLAHGCSVQHKRRGESAELQFRATIVNPVEPAFAVSNVIKSSNDSTLLNALYTNGKLSNIPVCNGCNLTGSAETGNLTVRLDNLQKFNGGTYKFEVNGKEETASCITLIVLGKFHFQRIDNK